MGDLDYVEKSFTIGRAGNNNIILTNPAIGNWHAEIICLSNYSFILEDKDSTNGTYVNDLRIKRKVVGRSDIVFLADLKFDLNIYFPLEKINKEIIQKFNVPNEPRAEPIRKSDPNDFTKEFAPLELVYKSYAELRSSLQGKSQLKMALLRAAPGAALGLLLTFVLPTFGLPLLAHAATYSSTIGSSVGGMLGVYVSNKANNTEKIEALNEEFKMTYLCPNPVCREFLGWDSWKMLAARKKHRCGAKFVI